MMSLDWTYDFTRNRNRVRSGQDAVNPSMGARLKPSMALDARPERTRSLSLDYLSFVNSRMSTHLLLLVKD